MDRMEWWHIVALTILKDFFIQSTVLKFENILSLIQSISFTYLDYNMLNYF
jgi:hypothetical protein